MIDRLINKILYKNKVLDVPETPIDERDWELKPEMIANSENINLQEFSRRYLTPPVKNQGGIGSCVGHSGRVVYGDTLDFDGKEPSAMWIYKKGKIHDPFPGEDYSGTTIKGACRGLIKEGCCEEKFWPYLDDEDAPMLEGAAENAAQHKIDSYYVIPKQNHDLIKKTLLQETLWTSIKVNYEFYYTPKSGIVNTEKYLASSSAGGHAIAMTGWKIIEGELYWEFQNSWGKSFGNDGFFYLESSLYEQILINNSGPIYLNTKAEANAEELERKRKQAEERQKQDEQNKKQRTKSKLIAAGMIGLMSLITFLLSR
ncbi:MAG: hypothetical protein CL833_05760 [Crocinitomicaceae bacterium]|nr:hypothetical protein [Crocinitomicaceae bacterium]